MQDTKKNKITSEITTKLELDSDIITQLSLSLGCLHFTSGLSMNSMHSLTFRQS